MIDFVAATAAESERFAAAAAEVAELADPSTVMVPSCPDWSVDDLVWHLTEVQHFWASIVEGRPGDPSSVVAQARPPSAMLIDRFVATSARLIEAVDGLAPDVGCWSWYQPDQRVGWVQRRQAHEALIHRVDAELARSTAGGPDVGSLDGALAADGVDEMLRIMLGVDPMDPWATWTPDGPEVRLVATVDGAGDRSWVVGTGRRTGVDPKGQEQDDPALRVAPADDGQLVVATVRGPAAELDRWLWRRGGLERSVVDGDRAAVERIPALLDG